MNEQIPTEKPIFDPETSPKESEFGVDKGQPIEQGQPESWQAPFDNDEHLKKAAENIPGQAAKEATAEVPEAGEAAVSPNQPLETPAGESDSWIADRVAGEVPEADAFDTLNHLLKETQKKIPQE
jgi:hypothetical protein